MKQNPQQFYKRVIFSIIVLISIYVIGIIGYMLIEKMPLLDAIFMTTITITTVGYGIIKNLSTGGTIFTIILIIIGTGTVAYILISLADFLLSEFLSGRGQDRRIKKMISELKNHYIICGLGRVGYEIASELAKDKADFIAIDSEDKPIELCKQNNWLYIKGDASEDKVLIGAEIKKAKALFAALDTESENVYVTLSARAINPDIFIVARAKIYETISKLERAGADRVVSPQIIGGRRMASLAKHPAVVEFLDIAQSTENIDITLAEIRVGSNSKISGLTIKDANEKYKFGALIVSVIEEGSTALIINASANTVIKTGQKLIVVGTADQIEKLSNLSIGL